MHINKKLEYVLIHMDGIATHDDAPAAEVIEALTRVRDAANKAIADVAERRADEQQ
ncbi:MAG: hypothetical protein K0R43_1704 [Pseudoduganella sp.]|nr:hypothetical protein [Pseudoduganella sp.]